LAESDPFLLFPRVNKDMEPGSTPSLPVILNASAGPKGEALAGRIQEAFAKARIEPSVRLAREGSEIPNLAQAAVREGGGTVVAAGGDGAINCVASALAGTGLTLAVIPGGTLNHFAKDLNIPMDLAAAAEVVATGRQAQVDAGEVNGRLFLNNSSLGLYPSLVERRDRLMRGGAGKWPAFFRALVEAFHRYPMITVRLHSNGRELLRRTPFVFVGNNEYAMDGLKLGSRESLDRGELVVYLSHRTGRLGLIALTLNALLGRAGSSRSLEVFKTTEMWVESAAPVLRVSIDGEVVRMRPPLHYSIRPRVLRVLVPAA
jgi:diacylglycerol kinase family enzyme